MSEPLVIYNPASRRGQALAEQLQPRTAGLRWVGLTELAKLKAQPERVVAVGGDGTVNAVASWLRQSDLRCPVGIVPGGTGNNLFYGLGLPANPQHALSLALTSAPATRSLDVISYCSAGSSESRLVLQSAAIGFPADVAARYDALRHRPVLRRAFRPLGKNTYRLLALGQLLSQIRQSTEPLQLRMQLPGEAFDGPILALFIGNERSLGGNFLPCPQAQVDDGLLDLCVVRTLPVLSTLRLFQLIGRGEHLDRSDAVFYRQSRGPVELQLDRAVPIMADGDLWETSDRFTLELTPAACEVIVAASANSPQ